MVTQTLFDRSMIIIIFFFFVSSSSAYGKTLTVELIHRDSPRSPLYNPLHTTSDRLNAAFRRSISRSRHFSTKSGLVDLRSGLIGKGEYFMTISIGTPPSKVMAMVDTGSDLTWIQCKPCQQCYKQNRPVFDQNQSSTYKPEPCHSTACDALSKERRAQCDQSRNICTYNYSYGDNSITKGDVATETISIDSSSSGSPVSFPGITIGCGHDNSGLFDKTGSGIIGLGGGPLSLVTQLGASIGNKFSYCLSSSTKSFINLGTNSIPSNTRNDSVVFKTPLVGKEDSKTFYLLTLKAITVGKTKLPYTGGKIEKTGNIIIDSRTTHTLLESPFYDGFGAAVEESVTGAKRVSDPEGILTHCFKARDKEIGLPEITMHFTNADVKLSPINAFKKRSDGTMCLSMTSTADRAIYGNLIQMGFLVGYDLVNKIVSFQRMDCSGNM